MRRARLLGALLLAPLVTAADTCPVLAVPAPDRVVVTYRGLPVEVPLAYITVPEDAAARSTCQEQLANLVRGRRVTLTSRASYGTDADGAARVLLACDGRNVSEALLFGGYARFAPGASPDRTTEQPLRAAEAAARDSQRGLWHAPPPAPAPEATAAPAEPVPAPAAPASAPVPPPAEGAPTGPFVAEIDAEYYYPTGDHAVANVNPQRLIYYPSEDAAQRAGKHRAPAAPANDLTSDGSEASADAIFARGKDIYAHAIAAGNTPERDDLYGQAFVVLTKAMQVYSALCEKQPDNDALGEKLRQCMQLRYGSVKQRRFE